MTPLLLRTSGRTGSTVLLNLLRSSPEIWVRGAYPFEERLLSYFYRLSAVPFTGQAPIAGSQWTHESLVSGSCALIGRYPGENLIPGRAGGQERIFQAIWQAYSQLIDDSECRNYIYLAEKANDDLALINNYVSCKNIFLIRDPRDQLVSIREFDKKRGYKGFGPSSDSGVESIRCLCRSIRDIFKVSLGITDNDERRILIRYEDLVTDQEGVLSRLAAWLSVTFDLDAFNQENATYRSTHSTTEKPIESVGRWRSQLTEDEVAVFKEELGVYMDQLGYL